MQTLTIEQLYYLHCGPIDLQVRSGECVGLGGASGSGKSLLLRALADMEPHRGLVRLDTVEQQLISAHQWRRKVGLLPAESAWWFDTVGEHFRQQPVEHLQQLGFDGDVSHWSVSRLSSGEKQRLGLLRLLENQPEVLLLDEPTANLDRENTGLFETFIADYLARRAACALWVAHDTEQLERVSTHRYELRDGALSAC